MTTFAAMHSNNTRSMTGFGKAEIQFEDEKLVLELRTLNSKQLDMYLKLPPQLKELEMEMRRIMTDRMMRGKVELNVSFEGGMERRAIINTTLATEYHEQLTGLSEQLSVDSSSSDILALIMRMPDVLQTERSALDESKTARIIETLLNVCEDLDKFRLQEGETLEQDLKEHIQNVLALQDELAPHIDPRIDRIRERVKKNLEQQMEGKDFDLSRFEQELIFYLEKYDVSEEMTRLRTHCDFFLETLVLDGAKGKKLGFISQEIGREINTLGAKSYDSDMQKLVVQMKDLLEKIKEQALNVL